jgi:uroporphyrinogen-III synthase
MGTTGRSPIVIVTRPEPDASRFAALLGASGMLAVVSPVVQIDLFLDALDLSGAGGLIFTSANGVRAFSATGGAPRGPAFAVGPATAAAARAAGFADVVVGGGDVETLAGALLSFSKTRPGLGEFVHIVGRHEAGDLAGRLAAEGLKVRRALAYEAKPAAGLSPQAMECLTSGARDLFVAHFSIRSAKIFEDLCEKAGIAGRLSAVDAAVLSPAIARSLMFPWRRVVAASSPSPEALIAAIRKSR